jgi:diguanylate cyclase (GGDEF)-like protein
MEQDIASTIIALILPASMAIVACAFLVASRFGMPAALFWGLGLGLCGLGFATSILPGSPHVAALVSDFVFVVGFFFYAEAYLQHFRKPSRRSGRMALVGLYLIANLYVVLGLESLQLELLLNDVVTSCMLGLALGRVVNDARSTADRALVLTGSVVVIDSLVRVLVYVYFSDQSDRLEDFGTSPYAMAMRISTSIAGLLYVMSIAAALVDRVFRELRDAAERDPLTGLFNRRGFARAVAHAARSEPLGGAVIVGDIDNFKLINDAFGHAAGDRVIRALADELAAAFGPRSIAARFGGEEFVCVIPNATLAEAGVAAQAVRLRFAARDWRSLGVDSQITASFGVVLVANNERAIEAAVARADACLYAAKAAGRNQVVLEGGMFELKNTPVMPPEPEPASNVILLRRNLA